MVLHGLCGCSWEAEGVVNFDRERNQPRAAYFLNCSILDGRASVDGVFSKNHIKRPMRRNNRQLRLTADSPFPSTTLTDTSGNPSESYHWRQMAAVRQEWQQEFWHPYVNEFELSLAEITNIETRVRRELYP